MRRHVRIEYTLRPEVDVETYKSEVNQFVSGMHAHHASHTYAVYQHEREPRRFTHVGSFDAELSQAMQREAFFEHFTAYLRGAALNGPDVQMVAPIATT